MFGIGWFIKQIALITFPVALILSAVVYDGSHITIGAVAVWSPLLIPVTLPSSPNVISSTGVLSMYVPPWMAQSLENASGRPPSP